MADEGGGRVGRRRSRRPGRVGDMGGFDRVDSPDPRRPMRADVRGKRALFSVDPAANPAASVLVLCQRCGVERGLTLRESLGLLRPPVVFNPFGGTLWTRCPTCERRTWLEVHSGPGIPWI